MLRFYPLALGCLLLANVPSYAQLLLSEDFSGGLPENWISRVESGNGLPSAAWQFTTTGPAGPAQGPPLNSTTAANGWMIFDSDLNCEVGNPQDAWLISPPIDASTVSTVWLLFSTYYASYNDQPQIRIGADLEALEEWASIEVFPGVQANSFGGPDPEGELNPYQMRFNLTPWLAGQDNQRVAFQFRSDSQTFNGGDEGVFGCAYWWQIDDVQLTATDPRPLYDMGITPFASIAPNAITPFCQLSDIPFLADVVNNGQRTPDSTILRLNIRNLDEELVYSEQVTYGPIAPDSIAENVFFQRTFLPPMAPNLYTGTYSLEYPGIDEDGQPADNTFTFSFLISDNVFAKETGFTRSVAPGNNPSYTYGNVFFVPQGQGKYVQEVSFAVANASELNGRDVTLLLGEWDGRHADSRILAPEEYNIIGFADYTFSGQELNSRISLPIRTIADEPVALKDSMYYIAAVQYNTTDDVTMEILASKEYDYFATIFQTDSLGIPQYASVLNIVNEDAENEFDLLGFGYDIVPTVRMTIDACVPSQVSDPYPSQYQAKVYPNPTADMLYVEALPENPLQWIRLYNLQGQLLMQHNAASHELKAPSILDLSDLESGSYILQLFGTQGIQTTLMQKI